MDTAERLEHQREDLVAGVDVLLVLLCLLVGLLVGRIPWSLGCAFGQMPGLRVDDGEIALVVLRPAVGAIH